MTAKKDNPVTPPARPLPLGLSPEAAALKPAAGADASAVQPVQVPPLEAGIEEGGPKGPEPTRFGDWERKGRCTDF